MINDKTVIKHWIDTINNEGVNLTKSEKDFMDSITEQFEKRGSLSEKQKDIVERIYADKTP